MAENDLVDRIERAARRIDPRWRDEDIARGWRGIVRRRRRRMIVRAGVGMSAAAVVVVLLWAARTDVAPEATLRLADGSLARAIDPATELSIVEDSARAAVVDLARGRGRFEVAPRQGRAFSVRAGEVTVTVLGTVFTVERVADRIGVAVERGQVQVAWPTGERRLRAGESGWFPPLVGAPAEATTPAPRLAAPVEGTPRKRVAMHAPSRAPVAPPAPAPVAPPVSAPPAETVAPAAPVAPPPAAAVAPPVAGAVAPPVSSPPVAAVAPPDSPPPAPSTPDRLLAAADEARLARRPAEALAPLERLLLDHAGDPRAPLAAFTLGRVLLTELGRPREAAAAFARARALAPSGPFAEDALAREVEAWAKAGEATRARQRATEYQRLYPAGRRLGAVRGFGGL